jgi:choline kinase
VHAIILAAGQGKRLLPLTSDRPKSTIRLAQQSMLAWQVGSFTRVGFDRFTIVTGYMANHVDDELARLRTVYPQCEFASVFNPFYSVADNLVSCWMVREQMDDVFVLVNGDTIFHSSVLEKLMSSKDAPITLAVDQKEVYDEDDMKVHLDGTRLVEIGKDLPKNRVNGESIGMLYFRGDGPVIFKSTLEKILSADGGLDIWYLSAIGAIAQRHEVQTQLIENLEWCEVDFPKDRLLAEEMVGGWQ